MLIGFRKINVIDNMIRMLEQHTEHLEELVESRTQELDEEKKKVENLLYNILPRYWFISCNKPLFIVRISLLLSL
jgi:hypothetical protein